MIDTVKCCNGCDAPVYAPNRVLCQECFDKLGAKIKMLCTANNTDNAEDCRPRWDSGSLAEAVSRGLTEKGDLSYGMVKEADAVQRLMRAAREEIDCPCLAHKAKLHAALAAADNWTK
jgi:hypothetical protein